jgi:hypothetical protein
MKRITLVLTVLLVWLYSQGGELIMIRSNGHDEARRYFSTPGMKVNYYNDRFIIATIEHPMHFSYQVLDRDAWSPGMNYYLTWIIPGESERYMSEISRFATVLFSSDDHLIIRVSERNAGLVFPAVHNGLVKLEDTQARLAERGHHFNRVEVRSDSLVAELIAHVNADTLLSIIQHLQDYGTRNCHTMQSVEAQNWIKARFESYGLQTELMDFTMPGGAASDNVIATLEGTLYPDEYVILGAHYDTYSYSGNAPGADDNATGTAGILEIARILSQYQFDRTILFCTWSGEEYGLYGSGAFATNADETGMNILGYFNIDMSGYLREGDTIHTDIIAPASAQDLVDFYEMVTAIYLPDFIVGPGNLSGGDSDHTSFNNHGFMGIFPFEDSQYYSPYIHTSGDTIGISVNNIEQVKVFTQAILACVMTMSDMLAPPTNLVGFAGDGSVTLKWDTITNALSYNIYRDNEPVAYASTTAGIYTDTAVNNGQSYSYYVTALYEGGKESIPSNVVTVIPSPPLVFPFSDDFETGGVFWNMEEPWGLTTTASHSPTHSMTDSPDGIYGNNINIASSLRGFDLSYYTGASFSFWTKYALESGYDYVYVEASINGSDWIMLDQFTGTQTEWVNKVYPLTGYLGHPYVSLRFRLYTDIYTQADGIYIDDFEINVEGIGIDDGVGTAKSELKGIYPNPSKGETNLSFTLESDRNVLIEVYDLLGKKIGTVTNEFYTAGTHTVIWNGINTLGQWAWEGIYVVKMSAGDNFSEKKLILIK